MKRTDLPEVMSLAGEIEEIQRAIDKARSGVFRESWMIVFGLAHGQGGADGRPQSDEVRLPIEREELIDFLSAKSAALAARLRALGVE